MGQHLGGRPSKPKQQRMNGHAHAVQEGLLNQRNGARSLETDQYQVEARVLCSMDYQAGWSLGHWRTICAVFRLPGGSRANPWFSKYNRESICSYTMTACIHGLTIHSSYASTSRFLIRLESASEAYRLVRALHMRHWRPDINGEKFVMHAAVVS